MSGSGRIPPSGSMLAVPTVVPASTPFLARQFADKASASTAVSAPTGCTACTACTIGTVPLSALRAGKH